MGLDKSRVVREVLQWVEVVCVHGVDHRDVLTVHGFGGQVVLTLSEASSGTEYLPQVYQAEELDEIDDDDHAQQNKPDLHIPAQPVTCAREQQSLDITIAFPS